MCESTYTSNIYIAFYTCQLKHEAEALMTLISTRELCVCYFSQCLMLYLKKYNKLQIIKRKEKELEWKEQRVFSFRAAAIYCIDLWWPLLVISSHCSTPDRSVGPPPLLWGTDKTKLQQKCLIRRWCHPITSSHGEIVFVMAQPATKQQATFYKL